VNWGSEGAVYERKNINDLLPLLHQAHLVAVHKGDEIVGTAIFCHSDVTVAGQPFICEYIRYFAAGDEIKGKKLIKHFAGKVMELVRQGVKDKIIYIGCVEKGNIRSYKVVENAGYKPVGVLTVNAFSRFFPKAFPSIEQVYSEKGKAEVMSLLKKQYEKHSLVHYNYIFQGDNYYIVRERGEIVAGCQFHVAEWKINKMPGLSGKIILHVLPHLPLISRLFNPKGFRFLAVEGIYFKEGYVSTFLKLLEGLLHQQKMHSALFWLAEDCPYRKIILDTDQLGLLHSFVKNSGAQVMASYKNMTDEEIQLVESHPQFASAFDYI
jgi:hypothetical protein